MFEKRGKAQSWSFDLILAFVVFILVIGILYALLSSKKTDKVSELELGVSTLSSNIDSETALNTETPIITKGAINADALEALYEKNASDYDALKEQLGLRGDFCIYIVDQNEFIIPVNNKTGFGKGDIQINGVDCGTYIS